MGEGPFYVFHTPFHLPHIQIASTIARAVLFGDPTVTPLGAPVCEVITIAKRNLQVGERVGWGRRIHGLRRHRECPHQCKAESPAHGCF